MESSNPPQPPDQPAGSSPPPSPSGERPTRPVDPKPAATDPVVVDDPVHPDRLRTLRRWMAVLSIWALAATAIAVLAFVEARDAKSEQDSARSATRADIERVQQRLRTDVDQLRADVDRLPTQAEVNQLQTRLRRVQRDATAAANDASTASTDADDLATQLEALESQVDSLETTANDGAAAN